jgi:hypothetical protein
MKMRRFKVILPVSVFCLLLSACSNSRAGSDCHIWQKLTGSAAFSKSYNYQVFVLGREMYALNNGGWKSKDGKIWTKTALPEIEFNSAYQKYVQFNGAVYALGTMRGDYMNLRLSSKISRTRDFENWETVAERSNLPERVFYGAVVFQNKIWLAGGFDGRHYYNDIWNSADGVNWKRVAETTAWSPRIATRLIVFKGRLWLLGGGVIDGEKTNNPHSGKEFWSSANGINWALAEIDPSENLGGTPVVFDDKLWLIGANRSDGNFSSAVYASDDGRTWHQQSAPWSPRGGTVAWVFEDKLLMTGGKFSRVENGEIKFFYSNDVWSMSQCR